MVVLMAEPRITRLSVVDKSELWRLWRSGQTLSEIAVALGRPPATVFNVLKINGGYSPGIVTGPHWLCR